MFGFLNINKPTGITSRKVVDLVNRLAGKAKVGHAGTLDPLATGVLVVCVGPATRLASFVQKSRKRYVAQFRLGLESDSEDIEGNVVRLENVREVDRKELEKVLPQFTGRILQKPPRFSALKVNGKRAYAMARRGKDFDLKPRPIEIFHLNLLDFKYPNFKLAITCGSGTYVRSLGRDIGLALGSNAIMTELDRTAVGGFSIDEAVAVEQLDERSIESLLIAPVNGLASLPRVELSESEIDSIRNGGIYQEPLEPETNEVAAIDRRGRLVCVLTRFREFGFKPAINFSSYWEQQGNNGN